MTDEELLQYVDSAISTTIVERGLADRLFTALHEIETLQELNSELESQIEKMARTLRAYNTQNQSREVFIIRGPDE